MVTVDYERIVSESRKRSQMKGRTKEEEDTAAQTAARIAASLAVDHASVLSPDSETPFRDATDVVKRLLPYHIFQYPKEDLMNISGYAKGKRKATEEELLREEIAGVSPFTIFPEVRH